MAFFMKDDDHQPHDFYRDPYGTWCKHCGNGANTVTKGDKTRLHCCLCEPNVICWSCEDSKRKTKRDESNGK